MLGQTKVIASRKPFAAALLLFPALFLAGCGKKTEAEAKPTRPVLVATVHYEPESPQRSFVGTIRPRIAQRALGYLSAPPPVAVGAVFDALTAREREILQEIVQGKPTVRLQPS